MGEYLRGVLTVVEWEILQWMALGLTDQEISEKMPLTTSGVIYHKNKLFDKMNSSSRTRVVTIAFAWRLLDSEHMQRRLNGED